MSGVRCWEDVRSIFKIKYVIQKYVLLCKNNVNKNKYPKWWQTSKMCKEIQVANVGRYRESGTYNDLIEYGRVLKVTTKAYKETKRKFEKNWLRL